MLPSQVVSSHVRGHFGRQGRVASRSRSGGSGLSQANPVATNSEDPEGHLHRVIVEIRDAMIDPRITFDISTDDRDLLGRAESHLVGSDSALTTTLTVPNIEEREP